MDFAIQVIPGEWLIQSPTFKLIVHKNTLASQELHVSAGDSL